MAVLQCEIDKHTPFTAMRTCSHKLEACERIVRIVETSGERQKNISCSAIFLCIPMYSYLVEDRVKGVLTTRKRVRKMQ
ncbi:hypothetical protein WL88_25445 [Burkholderia diffusa]|uniref:Uncharacterized protein n=1 Tax=Burkholderia diffusa TaxID=488732 RepID=A0AAW3P9F3_9BURK|nr:hypothetical protein WL86_29460 [Burkholderia diffusa]KWF38620.1 hypothetical protein WL85_10630 [Burkholderia diffusa]KWF46665.1 hypothetical protein WL88_25445 [Burkholderia diffusa]KWF50761.1 hypothetical protein WL87_16470 [Burkholderia diffusa]